MYGENCTNIMVYNLKRCTKKGDWKTDKKKKIKKYNIKGRTPESWLYYSSYVEDDFSIFYLQLSFQTIHYCYLLSKFRLVLSPTLYKFIVWACWAWTQSCFGVQVKTGPYNWCRLWGELDLIRRRFWFSTGNGRVSFVPTNDRATSG